MSTEPWWWGWLSFLGWGGVTLGWLAMKSILVFQNGGFFVFYHQHQQEKTKRHALRNPLTLQLERFEPVWMFPKIVGFPQIIHFNRVFQYNPSIFGVFPYFWKHPFFLGAFFLGSSFFEGENFHLPEVDTCSVPWIGSIHVLGSQSSGRWMDGLLPGGCMEVLGKKA